MKKLSLYTPRGVIHIHEKFNTRSEAEASGYCYYFSHEGTDIYICHFDKKNIYRVHFACVEC